MSLEFISENEWRDRVSKGTFAPQKVISHISTSPVKLSIGSFDQPIVKGTPYFIGINMTSAEGPKSEIVWEWQENNFNKYTTVLLDIPEELGITEGDCKPRPKEVLPDSSFLWTGELEELSPGHPYFYTDPTLGGGIRNRAIFCRSANRIPTGLDREPGESVIEAPSESFLIRAHSDFRFRRWVEKDTLFAFSDVCDKGGEGEEDDGTAEPPDVVPVDTIPPSAPTGLNATIMSTSRVDLVWGPATDDVDIKWYEIYKDGTRVGTSIDTYYSDTLDTGQSFVPESLSDPISVPVYTVYAVDTSDNKGPPSEGAKAAGLEVLRVARVWQGNGGNCWLSAQAVYEEAGMKASDQETIVFSNGKAFNRPDEERIEIQSNPRPGDLLQLKKIEDEGTPDWEEHNVIFEKIDSNGRMNVWNSNSPTSVDWAPRVLEPTRITTIIWKPVFR